MDNSWGATLVFVVLAAILAALAAVSAPASPPGDLFTEEGQPFFPEFKDPTVATSIEIHEYDEDTASVNPFKVELRKGKWVIPSHENYPAEARDRLTKTAGSIIALVKLSLRAHRKEDHAKLGVLDPTEQGADLRGRGMRVTLRDESDNVLADLVIGRDAGEEEEKKRFVRLPGSNRVYVAKIDFSISGKFHDWIEPDLLKIDRWGISKVEVDNYRIDERSRQVVMGDVHVLTKKEYKWTLQGQKENEEVNQEKLDALLDALDKLKIVDVFRKPEGITRDLKKAEGFEATREKAMLLGSKGFFFTNDGDLVSNEGEVRVWTDKGVKVALRFGELAPGGKGNEERRYLFVTAEFDEAMLPKPEVEKKEEPKEGEKKDDAKKGEEKKDDDKKDEAKKDDGKKDEAKKDEKKEEEKPAEDDPKIKEWKAKVEEGKRKAKELNDRFADWYYVIPGEEFVKTRLKREDLVREKAKEDQ